MSFIFEHVCYLLQIYLNQSPLYTGKLISSELWYERTEFGFDNFYPVFVRIGLIAKLVDNLTFYVCQVSK